jgi:hypothetical protein
MAVGPLEKTMSPNGQAATENKKKRTGKRSVRRIALKVGALLVVGWVLLQFLGPYTRLKNRMKWQVGTDRLQGWAMDALENRPPPADVGPPGAIARDALPDDIRPLAAECFVVIVDQTHAVEEHVLFACGGGFYHYGLRVGSPAFRPTPDRQFRMERLADGVWGLRER